MMLDAVQYKNGRKNNWRAQVWNILRECGCLQDGGIILYLPGGADLDRRIATRKGLDCRNLIAIERDKRIVSDLRSRGVNVINGELSEVMACWPKNHLVSAIIADFTCGIERGVLEAGGVWLSSPAFSRCALVVNLQRGRDSAGKFIVATYFENMATEAQARPGFQKNRAAAFIFCLMRWVRKWSENHPDAHKWVKFLFLPSYKSNRVLMDSAVILPPREFAQYRSEGIILEDARKNERVRRRIAAALAVRSMRFDGTLKTVA